MGDGCTDPELVLDCFQQGLTEVANAEHVERTTIGGGQQRERATSSEMTPPKTSGAINQDHVDV